MAALGQASDLTESISSIQLKAGQFIDDLADIATDIVEQNEESFNDVAELIEDSVYQGALIYDYMSSVGGPGCATHCTRQAYACAADSLC